PYRRIAFCGTLNMLDALDLFQAPQITNLRYGRVQLCATNFGGRASAFVAQIFNLPYRRIAFCGTLNMLRALELFRLRRLQICDTAECNSALRILADAP